MSGVDYLNKWKNKGKKEHADVNIQLIKQPLWGTAFKKLTR